MAKQCPSCPWRVDCRPTEDIPNGYSVDLHKNLRGTIAEPGVCGLTRRVHRIMACHYSKPGEEFPCAGWLYHQLGEGNNLWLRLKVMQGEIDPPEIDGEQHQTFDDTIPKLTF